MGTDVGAGATEEVRKMEGRARPDPVREDCAEDIGDDAANIGDDAEDDRLDRTDRVAVLWGEITAATRAFLAAVAECDRHRDWEAAGFGSCAEWLAWRLGITRNTANEKVRVARALERLPETSDAMARGELSFSKVRALTRAATAENESDLLEFARASSAAKLERLIRGWKRLDREDEATQERIRHASRSFSVFSDQEGMYVVRGRLPAEVGAALMRAVEAAADALFHPTNSDTGHPEENPEPAQLRADAVGLVAERALAAGLGENAAESGSRAERYQVVLHLEEESLSDSGEPGQCELADGTRVTAETARQLACDSGRVEMKHASSAHRPSGRTSRVSNSSLGAVLDVGRRSRTVPPALRRALDARDRGCRFPGCGLRFTDAHHIEHWADGGATRLENLVLLCRRHHRRVHESGYSVCLDRNGRVAFFRPDGSALFDAPALPTPGAGLSTDPVARLVRRNRSRGVRPGALSTAPGRKRDSDIPWTIEARAREALDGQCVCERRVRYRYRSVASSFSGN